MREDIDMRYMEGDEGREPGTILLWLGICIAIVGLLLLVFHFMTCPCNDSVGEERADCICVYGGEILLTVIGTVIAFIGLLIRSRHRRKVASEKRP